jgi:hypothetical protein
VAPTTPRLWSFFSFKDIYTRRCPAQSHKKVKTRVETARNEETVAAARNDAQINFLLPHLRLKLDLLYPLFLWSHRKPQITTKNMLKLVVALIDFLMEKRNIQKRRSQKVATSLVSNYLVKKMYHQREALQTVRYKKIETLNVFQMGMSESDVIGFPIWALWECDPRAGWNPSSSLRGDCRSSGGGYRFVNVHGSGTKELSEGCGRRSLATVHLILVVYGRIIKIIANQLCPCFSLHGSMIYCFMALKVEIYIFDSVLTSSSVDSLWGEVYFSCDRKVSKYLSSAKDEREEWKKVLNQLEGEGKITAPAEKKVTTLSDFFFICFSWKLLKTSIRSK